MTAPTSRRLGPPQLWVFGGPNGAGKSTLAARQVRDRPPIVNPDEIARTLPPGRDGGPDILAAGRAAVLDRAYVIDNSGERRRLVMIRSNAQTRRVSRRLPDWIERAVPAELRAPDPA